MDVTWMPLEEILDNYRPGSQGDDWTWDDEEAHLHAFPDHEGVPGGYQKWLEASLAERGFDPGSGVCLGTDGRIWDGHHRIVAARRLGLTHIPVEAD